MAFKAPRIRARSFAIYYGYGPVAGLEHFDLAVLEPKGWRQADLLRLKQSHVRVLAYVSGLEAESSVAHEAGLTLKDFISLARSPWRKEPYHNLVVNPESVRWRRHLERTVTHWLKEGYDGIFLDTLGDVEDPAVSSEGAWLIPATADLVAAFRTWIGDRWLVMNNGVGLLAPLVHPHLDGIAWELAAEELSLKSPWAQMVLDVLGTAATQSGVIRLMITTITPGPRHDETLRQFQDLVRRLGFLGYAAPDDYARAIRGRDGQIILGKTAP